MAETNHNVEKAENIHSISFETGHFWEFLWNHPRNSGLKKTRSDPCVLDEGDVLFIPDLRQKWEKRETNQRHRFKRKGVPSILRFRPLFLGEPFVDQPYKIEVGGKELISGTTKENGVVECFVQPDAANAVVTIGSGYFEFIYNIDLRALPPIETTAGVTARLTQLGYGGLGQSEADACAAFQDHRGLKATGEMDEETRNALHAEFGR